MFEFFDWVVDTVSLIFDFFVNTVEMLFTMIQVVFTTIQSVVIMVGYIPPIISVSVLLVLFVSILNYFLGRSNQS